MILGRTTAGINKAEDAGTAHGQINSTGALQRVFPTRLTSYLQFRGWICQETLCGRSAVTFDLRQCAAGLIVVYHTPSCDRGPPQTFNTLRRILRLAVGCLDF